MEGVHDKPILKKKGLPKVGGGGRGGRHLDSLQT